MKSAGTLAILLQLVCFRGTPADLPAQRQLLNPFIVAVLAVNLITVVLVGRPLWLALAASAADLLVSVGVTLLYLHLAGHPARLLQTLLALLGSGVLLSLLLLPPALAATPETDLPAPWMFWILALQIWSLLVAGRIARLATGWAPLLGLGYLAAAHLVFSLFTGG